MSFAMLCVNFASFYALYILLCKLKIALLICKTFLRVGNEFLTAKYACYQCILLLFLECRVRVQVVANGLRFPQLGR